MIHPTELLVVSHNLLFCLTLGSAGLNFKYRHFHICFDSDQAVYI